MKYLALVVLFIQGLSASSFAQTHRTDWLIGSWESIDGDTKTIEAWSIENDSTLIGKAETTNGDSIVFWESLKIEWGTKETKYTAVLPFKTAEFLLTSSSESSMEFSDPKNDFPSLIRYERKEDSLDITLEGSGQTEKLHFKKQ